IPSVQQIKTVFESEGLNFSKLVDQNDSFTEFGQLIIDYMIYRGDLLTNSIKPNLMNKESAKETFYALKDELNPQIPLPYNKQKDEKKDYSYLTGIVNILINENKGNSNCDFDPKELTAFTENGYPIRTLSRRVDGAFPSVINPIAIWEIKEYYYTTTFGSRVADGVYETLLDGMELEEMRNSTGRHVEHALILDAHYTWWECGRSYLCRIIDMLNMGFVTEVLFGRE